MADGRPILGVLVCTFSSEDIPPLSVIDSSVNCTTLLLPCNMDLVIEISAKTLGCNQAVSDPKWLLA